jgi:hypothetical protein
MTDALKVGVRLGTGLLEPQWSRYPASGGVQQQLQAHQLRRFGLTPAQRHDQSVGQPRDALRRHSARPESAGAVFEDQPSLQHDASGSTSLQETVTGVHIAEQLR